MREKDLREVARQCEVSWLFGAFATLRTTYNFYGVSQLLKEKSRSDERFENWLITETCAMVSAVFDERSSFVLGLTSTLLQYRKIKSCERDLSQLKEEVRAHAKASLP